MTGGGCEGLADLFPLPKGHSLVEPWHNHIVNVPQNVTKLVIDLAKC